jgi:predicted murein hydrolase (TIGR00659 family)
MATAMDEFVQLWVYLSSTPLFGLTATLAVYAVAQACYDRVGRAPWANPVLWSVLCIGAVLVVTRTPYPIYFAGAQFVHVMLGPAVVALAWPLWLRRAEVRRRGVALLIAALVGGLAAGGSAVLLGWSFGMPTDILRSLAPKSVTAPVAMGIAERIGGVPALAAVFAVITGLVGALSARYLFNFLKIDSWAVRGFALGTASHGIGAARALQVDADAGAYAGIALGLQVLLASLLAPLLFRFF